MTDLIKKQQLILTIAQEQQVEKIQLHLSSKQPSDNHLNTLAVDSFVLVAYPEGHRPEDKLMCRWYGPMQVVEINEAAYHVRDLVTMKVDVVHVSRLKPFYQNGLIQPREVAYAEGCVWEVLKVHQHRKEGRARTGVSLLIEWAGFPQQKHWTWEPWSAHLGRNARIIEYLQQHKELKHLISGAFK